MARPAFPLRSTLRPTLTLSMLALGLALIAATAGRAPAQTVATWRHEYHPGLRESSALAYDPQDERIWLTGGIDPGVDFRGDEVLLDDAWTLDLQGDRRWRPLDIPEESRMPPRAGQQAVIDVTGRRLIVCGGQTTPDTFPPVIASDFWELSLEAPDAWQQILPTNLGPPRLFEHRMVMDEVGRRLLVFEGGPFDEGAVWALELAGDPTWTRIVIRGSLPSGTPAVAYAAQANRIFALFDGDGLYAATLDDEARWSEVEGTEGLDSNTRFALAVDPAGTSLRCIDGNQQRWTLDLGGSGAAWRKYLDWSEFPFFGGTPLMLGDDGALALNELGTWLLRDETPGGRAWRSLEPSALVARRPSAVYAPSRDEWILFGGSLPTPGQGWWANTSELWSLRRDEDLTLQRLVALGDAPPARSDHAAVLDPVRGRMLVIGGVNESNPADVWALELGDPPRWSQVATEGEAPFRGSYPLRAAYDATRDRVLLLTPSGVSSDQLDEAWSLELSEVPPRFVRLRPEGLFRHVTRDVGAVFENARDRWVFVTSGRTVWSLDFSRSADGEWIEHTTYGDSPRTGGYRSVVLDAQAVRLIVHGGTEFSDRRSPRSYTLGLREPMTWEALETQGAPPSPRAGHRALWDGATREMIVFGSGPYSSGPQVGGLSVLSVPPPAIAGEMTLLASRHHGAVVLRWNPPTRPEASWAEVMRRTAVETVLVGQVDLGTGRFVDSQPPVQDVVYWLQLSKDDDRGVLAQTTVPATEAATRLFGNVPNPFNPRTRIRFELAKAGPASLTVFDIAGRRVRALHEGHRREGIHEIVWDGLDDAGRPVASGTYVVRLTTARHEQARRVVLLR